jgi:hypothetical protein
MELYAYLMLADHAENAGGKLFINGGGWNQRMPNPGPWALALQVKVPWDDMNRRFKFRLELLDADSLPFEAETPEGQKPVAVEGDFHVTAHPQQKRGSQLNGLVAINLPPLALPAGEQFEWTLSIDGESRDEWRASFGVFGQAARRAA